MDELSCCWLTLSILIPLLGAAVVGRIHDAARARIGCLMICTLSLLTSCAAGLDLTLRGVPVAHDAWDPVLLLFSRPLFVVDDLNAPMLPLISLVCLLTVLSTLRTKIHRLSFGTILVTQSIQMATLSCNEPWPLIGLLSLAIIPPYLELRSRQCSERVFAIHMMLFVLLLILGQLFVDKGSIVVGGVLLTVAVLLRTGIVPLHCWMPDLFEKGTFGTALLFVVPLTGAYALIRLVLPIVPDWVLQTIAVISLFTAVYAGGMAIVQRNARRFFCYLFLSHSSLVMVGLELATPVGLTGGLCVWLSVVISLTGFGLTLRCVESRAGRISLDGYLGYYEHMPTLAAFFLLTGLASIGFPGTIGFIGTELLVEGTMGVYPLIGTAVAIATALNGIAILNAYFRVFAGSSRPTSISIRVRTEEKIAVLILSTLILVGGLYPQPGLSSRYHAVGILLELRGLNAASKGGERPHEARSLPTSAHSRNE